VRLHGIKSPAAFISSNDSTLLMIGLSVSPRPWTFDASAPPSDNRSAPVCF